VTDGRICVDGHNLEWRRVDGDPASPPLVFLHEGLGSARLWRDFPDRLAAATGRSAYVYSRYGYGDSDVLSEPRRPDYMHHEALVVLPALLANLDVSRPVLVGHSDGASIALISAGSGTVEVSGLVLLAPHAFVENESVAGIAAARTAYETTELAERLARHHRDGDATFFGWNDIWLSPEFRSWNIEEYVPGVRAPILCVQGDTDQYGTLAQIDSIRAKATTSVESLTLHCGHAPHLERPTEVLAAVSAFVARMV
jgi:pimeloyl-ACP methyl ester carboxylesterase